MDQNNSVEVVKCLKSASLHETSLLVLNEKYWEDNKLIYSVLTIYNTSVKTIYKEMKLAFVLVK